MGYNTTVVILNDALDQIKKDQDFGKNLVDAILSLSYNNRQSGPVVSSGSYCNVAQVIETHHTSEKVCVITGGNCGKKLENATIGMSLGETTENLELAVLKQLAQRHGFSLRKKPIKK